MFKESLAHAAHHLHFPTFSQKIERSAYQNLILDLFLRGHPGILGRYIIEPPTDIRKRKKKTSVNGLLL